MTKRLTFESPFGCSWCGDEQYHHGSQWAPIIGLHEWRQPTQEQIKERMLRRLDDRLNAEPPKYHATTAWAPDHTGESADPHCADCKTDVCHRWSRIQTRLDSIRWGLPHRTKHPRHALAGGWGGYQSDLPF
ncbi:hypothetical protein [Streptomyces sp. SID161]|uniref:hypothetical protein n=1 Tax=Streptomyces sp. SID161 TaxID=2690251 RepID=UPI0013FC4682|nr:hypothetical protein [Streptomyces sp. SID161]MYW46376.1 hypothetical protein [Streptomyces sp. SID161]